MLIVLALTLLLVRYFLWFNRRERRLVSGIPGPRGFPILGSVVHIVGRLRNLHGLALDYAAQYGSLLKVDTLGLVKIALSGPEEIEALLSCKNNIRKDNSYTFLRPWLATGLLTAYGDKWHSRRKLLTPAFHFNILEDFVPVFNANNVILVDKLRKQSSETHVDITEYVNLLALDNICETTMGIPVGAQKGGAVEYVKAVDRLCILFVYRVAIPVFQFKWFYDCTPWGREEKKILKILKGFSENVIRSKRLEQQNKTKSTAPSNKKSKKRLSFLDILLEMADEDGKLSDEDIREEVDTFMFAGHDTTASAICWTLYLLGMHQDIQEKLYSEVLNTLGSENQQPTMSELQNMTYMEQVVKEVLRLYPSVPAISRNLDEELTINGHTIPPGLDVIASPFVLHRNPEIYPDPDKFDPERFSPEQSAGRHPYAYLPFSAGPRNCIGQKFARLEIKSVLCSVLQNFKMVSLPRDDELSFVPGIVLRPSDHIKIKFFPRNV